MTIAKHKKELAEMMRLWNCGEREAIQQFLHAIYIAKGNRPDATAEFINHLPDDELARVFIAVMEYGHKELSFINPDLLAIQPIEP